MTTPTNNTESKTEITKPATGYETEVDAPPADTDKSNVDDGLDDLGYETPKVDPIVDDKPKVEPEVKPEDVKVETPATGYDKPPVEPKVETEPEKEDPNAEKNDKTLTKENVDVALGELPEGYDKERTAKFALDNKMTKEQLENFVAMSKEDSVNSKKDQEAQVLATRAGWHKELQEDKEFGGEHFDVNVHKVDQVLEKFFPNMKKALTDNKGMMPPYLMRDFLKVSKLLDPTTELIDGEPKAVVKETNILDEMYN